MFVHVVFFWIKPDAPAIAKDQTIADAREFLSSIPGIAYFDVGRPAMTPRDVVDNSYSVGLLIVFRDSAAHDVYQTHAQHLKFIERNKANWEQVKIYDFAS